NFFTMVNRNLLRQYELSDDEVNAAFAEPNWLPEQEQEYEVNKVVNGTILHILGDEVWIDVGYKSEGVIPLEEWKDEGLDQVVPPQPGEGIQVLLEAVEDESGAIDLRYRKAKRQREWADGIAKHTEGDVITG